MRFELYSTPNSAPITNCLRLVLALCNHQFEDIVLSTSEEEKDKLSSLRTVKCLPVLFDHDNFMEMVPRMSTIHEIVRSSIFISSNPKDAVRADSFCEIIMTWLDNIDSDIYFSSEQCQTRLAVLKRIVQHFGGFSTLSNVYKAPLRNDSSRSGDMQHSITYGDYLLWLYLHYEMKSSCGHKVVENDTDMFQIYSALNNRAEIMEFASKYDLIYSNSPKHNWMFAVGIPRPVQISTDIAAGQELGTICVTGASGFLGSWITLKLLLKGYRVHATVRHYSSTDLDPKDGKVMKSWSHLLKFPNAKTHLRLFNADLISSNPDTSEPVDGECVESFKRAMEGAVCVFHTASPFHMDSSNSPETEFLEPAVRGTRNVLKATLETPSVKRVVVTSSTAAIYSHPRRSDHWYTEDDWSDEEYMRANNMWYALSKTLAEKEAWRIVGTASEGLNPFYPESEELYERPNCAPNLEIVTLCPTLVLGPLLSNRMNASNRTILDIMDGKKKIDRSAQKCLVDVRDVADAHIQAMENPHAKGTRVMLVAGSIPWFTVAEIIKDTIPNNKVEIDASLNVPEAPVQGLCSTLAAYQLGVQFMPLEITIADTAADIARRGFFKP